MNERREAPKQRKRVKRDVKKGIGKEKMKAKGREENKKGHERVKIGDNGWEGKGNTAEGKAHNASASAKEEQIVMSVFGMKANVAKSNFLLRCCAPLFSISAFPSHS